MGAGFRPDTPNGAKIEIARMPQRVNCIADCRLLHPSKPAHLRRPGQTQWASIGNRGPFQKHGNRNSFGVARGQPMKFPRRRFLHLAAGAAALPAVPRVAWSQAYPTRPVRIVVGLAPGGSVDIVTRLMGQWLSERLGQPFVTDHLESQKCQERA